VNKNTDIAPWKENLLRHHFVSQRGMFWKWGMHFNPEYTCHRILSDISVYLSERVKYLVLEELTFIIVNTANSKLPSYRQSIYYLKLL
jgi:hypothetical protein